MPSCPDIGDDPRDVLREHVTIRRIELDDIEKTASSSLGQFIMRAGRTKKRAVLVLLVNGIPLTIIEAKRQVRSIQSWLNAASQVQDACARNVPDLRKVLHA